MSEVVITLTNTDDNPDHVTIAVRFEPKLLQPTDANPKTHQLAVHALEAILHACKVVNDHDISVH